MPAADEVSGEHNVAGGLATTVQCFANNPPSNASLNRMQLSDMAQINCYQEVYLKFSTATMMCTNINTILHHWWKKDALASKAYSMGGISYQSKRPSQLATSNRWNMLFPVAGHVLFDLPRLQATSPEMVPCAI